MTLQVCGSANHISDVPLSQGHWATYPMPVSHWLSLSCGYELPALPGKCPRTRTSGAWASSSDELGTHSICHTCPAARVLQSKHYLGAPGPVRAIPHPTSSPACLFPAFLLKLPMTVALQGSFISGSLQLLSCLPVHKLSVAVGHPMGGRRVRN